MKGPIGSLTLQTSKQAARWVAVAAALVWMPTATWAQEVNNGATAPMVEILRRVDLLEKRLQESERDLHTRTGQLDNAIARIEQLESRQGESGVAATNMPAAQPVQAEHENPPQAALTSNVAEHDHDGLGSGVFSTPHLNIRGFGDVRYQANRAHSSSASFTLGQFDLFITSRISERLGIVVETVFEPGLDNAWGVDIERIFAHYRFSKYLSFEAGRNHTAIGYYNTAFHHATWLQTAVDRPFLFSFEDQDGPLPVHNVGVSASGDIPSGRFGLGYIVSLGNGRAFREPGAEPVQNRLDDNRGKALNFAIVAIPDVLPGLRLGASIYLDKLTPVASNSIRERILSGYLVYQHDRVEFLNEAVWMIHTQLQAASGRQARTSVPGGYTQLAYRFGAVRPYIRFEYLNPAASDPVARQLGFGPRREILGGIRYELAEFAAFKIQLGRLSQSRIATQNIATAQLSFTF